MTAVIIEDELHSRELLRNLVTELCEGVLILDVADSVRTGVALIERVRPDLVFLDIEMQSGTGFDLLQQVSWRGFEVIFTTAYDHYAIQAVKVSAVDYLLKPIDLDELQQAISRVRERRQRQPVNPALDVLMTNLRNRSYDHQTLTLSTAEGLEFVPLPDIIRLEAAGAYTTFFLSNNRRMLVSKNLKEYEDMLPDAHFLRIHNSHIVNLNYVRKMLRTDGGYAVMKDDSTLLISPRRKDEFMQRMASRGQNVVAPERSD